MNRRSFLQAILAAGMAPAVVRAESLMRCFVRRESGLLVPESNVVVLLHFDGGDLVEMSSSHVFSHFGTATLNVGNEILSLESVAYEGGNHRFRVRRGPIPIGAMHE